MTLIQTKKLGKKVPVVLFGSEYWNEVMNLEAMVKHGTISPEDMDLFKTFDSVDETFDYITKDLGERALKEPGGRL